MNQLRSIGIMNVDLELGQEVERELELLEDVDKIHFRRWLGANGQDSVTEILLLPTPATFLLKTSLKKRHKNVTSGLSE